MESKMIGSKIAEARKKINISQAQLAENLFISPQAVGKWERGESMPDITTFNRIAEILGVDLNYFSENFQSGITEMASDELLAKQLVNDAPDLSRSQERLLLTNFNGSDLTKSDFAGVTAHKGKFGGSALRGSDFAGADLTGSSFVSSDIAEANFDEANLTDCTLSTSNLTGASFNKTILVRTKFSKLALPQTKFIDVKLIDVMLNMIDLRETAFENCIFTNVDFKYCDLRWMCFDGQTFISVVFDRTALNDVTFEGATLKNVSFRPTFTLTNKYYRAVKTICFDGALMDKLTYASLKGIGAELSNVTLI